MKVESLKFDDDGLPKEVTVTMSVAEAAFVTMAMGAYTDYSVDLAAPQFKGLYPHHDVYLGMVASVFNPFWENGVADVIDEIGRRERG